MEPPLLDLVVKLGNRCLQLRPKSRIHDPCEANISPRRSSPFPVREGRRLLPYESQGCSNRLLRVPQDSACPCLVTKVRRATRGSDFTKPLRP